LPRKKSPNLTEAEFRLMNVLWKKGPATVGDVVEALPGKPPLAYSSVLTTLRILENKGFLRHTKEGRAFVYHPVVARKEATRKAIRHLVTRFFGGSRQQLLLNLLEDEEFDEKELQRIKKRISESE
jgi:BlaI family transcriptional regulator, penicillinase repressor